MNVWFTSWKAWSDGLELSSRRQTRELLLMQSIEKEHKKSSVPNLNGGKSFKPSKPKHAGAPSEIHTQESVPGERQDPVNRGRQPLAWFMCNGRSCGMPETYSERHAEEISEPSCRFRRWKWAWENWRVEGLPCIGFMLSSAEPSLRERRKGLLITRCDVCGVANQ